MVTYLQNWFTKSSSMMVFFDITFIAHMNPISLCLAIKTSPNLPLPRDFPIRKSFLEGYLNFSFLSDEGVSGYVGI